ncbi:hypothetical protein HPB51_007748 [Rhipicephalus microplus]|uniref:Tc1-like transposase DDE domain-containing protein n=1 Tax=Rhipicephalus microplus TaxID=6941 RepID=A0A9J6EF82_RHIMP|nr:hypothetical protein HPB51_007748 [Rhipicephalus microplus]
MNGGLFPKTAWAGWYAWMVTSTPQHTAISVLLPHTLNGPFKDGLFSFQHDRSPVHTAVPIKHMLEERCVMELDWPPQGVRINIIDNVWAEIKKNLSRLPLHKCSSDNL